MVPCVGIIEEVGVFQGIYQCDGDPFDFLGFFVDEFDEMRFPVSQNGILFRQFLVDAIELDLLFVTDTDEFFGLAGEFAVLLQKGGVFRGVNISPREQALGVLDDLFFARKMWFAGHTLPLLWFPGVVRMNPKNCTQTWRHGIMFAYRAQVQGWGVPASLLEESMRDALLFDLTNTLKRENLLLTFCGPFSQGIIEEIGTALQGYLAAGENPPSHNSAVFSIFIEQTQNIRNYFRSRRIDEFTDPQHGYGIVVIGNDSGRFSISSGNLISNDDLPALADRIRTINALTREELQDLYKQTLRNKRMNEGGGAGLGFIEMARRASQPLEFATRAVDAGHSFFTLHVVI